MKPWTVAVVIGLGLAACGSSGGADTEMADGAGSTSTIAIAATSPDHVASTTSKPTPSDTLPAEVVANTSGWVNDRVEISTAGMETRNGAAGAPEISAIGHSSVGYIAAGEYSGGLAIWRSETFNEFTPLYNEVCCDRYVSVSSVVEFQGTLLVAGSGREGATDREFSVLLRSDDGGTTWQDTELPPAGSASERLDALHVVGDSLLAEFVDQADGFQFTAHLLRTTDLATWEEIQLPQREPEDWPTLLTDGTTIFATASRNDPSSGSPSRVVWASTDAGRSFEIRPPVPSLSSQPVVVDGALVAVPAGFQLYPSDTQPTGLDVLDPVTGWTSLEPDVGQFGDGGASIGLPTTTVNGRIYAVLAREIRASAHYCYEDIDSCNQPEMALVAATGPTKWFDVAGPNLPAFWGRPGLVTAPNGTVVLWTTIRDEAALDVYRWASPNDPELIDPVVYPPPDKPIELFDDRTELEVGDEWRYVLALGFCGGMYINDSLWEPETPLPDPPTAGWPYQPERPGTADGPSGYLYGRIAMTDETSIDFSIEGTGVVATFRPAPPQEAQCG